MVVVNGPLVVLGPEVVGADVVEVDAADRVDAVEYSELVGAEVGPVIDAGFVVGLDVGSVDA